MLEVRAGSLVAVSKELSEYKLDLVEFRSSNERAVAPNQQEDTHFSTEIVNYLQVSLCIRESCV
jgi:hypothetical protein